MMFAIGFVVGIVLLVIASSLATRYMVKKGHYSSAIWSEKDKVWKVRGKYLSIGGKIFHGIKEEHATGRKSVKYID